MHSFRYTFGELQDAFRTITSEIDALWERHYSWLDVQAQTIGTFKGRIKKLSDSLKDAKRVNKLTREKLNREVKRNKESEATLMILRADNNTLRMMIKDHHDNEEVLKSRIEELEDILGKKKGKKSSHRVDRVSRMRGL